MKLHCIVPKLHCHCSELHHMLAEIAQHCVLHCLIFCINYSHTEWRDERIGGRHSCIIRSMQGIMVTSSYCIAASNVIALKSVNLIFIEVLSITHTEWGGAGTAA